MSIERSRGKILFVCDGDGGTCAEELQTDETDIQSAVAVLKAGEEWAIVYEDGTYYHYCGACAQIN